MKRNHRGNRGLEAGIAWTLPEGFFSASLGSWANQQRFLVTLLINLTDIHSAIFNYSIGLFGNILWLSRANGTARVYYAYLLSENLFGDNTLNLACHYLDDRQALSVCKTKAYRNTTLPNSDNTDNH